MRSKKLEAQELQVGGWGRFEAFSGEETPSPSPPSPPPVSF
jgi:hypothetical protein